MRPLWLIEGDAWGPSSELLKSEIRRQGMAFSVIRHEPFTSGYQDRVGHHILRDDDCIVFLGTWPLWRHIQLRWPNWTPGGWCSTENLDCAVYYRQFAPFLLNQDYSIITGSDALLQQKELFNQHASDGLVFIRPTSCVKSFNGRCVDATTFPSAIAPSRYDSDSRIVVARPQSIAREWRFVIAEHMPLVACQYYLRGKKVVSRDCPIEVWAFVEEILQTVVWQPDDVFVMDVCESEGNLRIVELNGFSCAGLYDCDLAKVIDRVASIAEKIWKTKHEYA